MQRDVFRGAMKKALYSSGMLILIGLSVLILMIWGMFVCMGAVDWLGLSVLLLVFFGATVIGVLAEIIAGEVKKMR